MDARKTADQAGSPAQKRVADVRIIAEAKKAAVAAQRALDTAKTKIAAAAKQPEQGSAQRVMRPAPVPQPGPVQRPQAVAGCQGAGAQVRTPGTYTVIWGDSLWRIAERHYGNGALFRKIQTANGKAAGDYMIHPCDRIRLPN